MEKVQHQMVMKSCSAKLSLDFKNKKLLNHHQEEEEEEEEE